LVSFSPDDGRIPKDQVGSFGGGRRQRQLDQLQIDAAIGIVIAVKHVLVLLKLKVIALMSADTDCLSGLPVVGIAGCIVGRGPATRIAVPGIGTAARHLFGIDCRQYYGTVAAPVRGLCCRHAL
jgi:hypothetical protein